MNATESFYIGSAWNQLIRNTISDEIIKDLNLKTQNKELMHFYILTLLQYHKIS